MRVHPVGEPLRHARMHGGRETCCGEAASGAAPCGTQQPPPPAATSASDRAQPAECWGIKQPAPQQPGHKQPPQQQAHQQTQGTQQQQPAQPHAPAQRPAASPRAWGGSSGAGRGCAGPASHPLFHAHAAVVPQLHGAAAAPGLDALPPDVMHRVLLFGSCRDAGSLRLASKRLNQTVASACSHWAPLVEARMQQSPHLRHLWARLAAAARQGASVNWLQAWCCLERAAQGPWSLDARALSRRAAPNGVLLVFEVLLQHVPPSADVAAAAAAHAAAQLPPPPAPGCAGAPGGAPAAAAAGRPAAVPVVVQQHAWKDNVAVVNFSLDGRRIEIVVDTSGRVSSPQHDWCQGTIALTPGVPRLLTLEVSYLLPVPSWFLHPATLDDATGRLALDLSCGFGSYVTDPRYSDGGGGAAAGGAAGSGGAGGGLERIELCGQLAWRPSRVASFFNRLLTCKAPASCKGGGARPPSPRSSNRAAATVGAGGGSAGAGGGAARPRGPQRGGPPGAAAAPQRSAAAAGRSGAAAAGAGGGSGTGVSVPGCVGVAYARMSAGGGDAPPPPPASSTHLLGVSKVAAWQVPADTEWRFAEGFLFSAEDHKAEQLLGRYRLLPPA